MKMRVQYIMVLFLLLVTGVVSAQLTVQSLPSTQLTLKNAVHDFGRIPQGKPVFYSFEIRNPSNETLSISDVQASCGCTTPEWNRQGIAPGGSGFIRVGYNAAAEGEFEKTIQAYYGNGQVMQMTIRGTVWKTPDQPAPSNKSIARLKNIKF